MGRVATILERPDLPDQFKRAVLPPRQVLDQAHDEAVLLGGLGDQRGDLGLAEGDEGLQPALAADQVVTSVLARADRDRPLEAQVGDARHKFLEDAPVAGPRVQHGDGGHGNMANILDGLRHAATRIAARWVRP
ncbi:hypothetical protein D3C80_1314340 [compost metagenome]